MRVVYGLVFSKLLHLLVIGAYHNISRNCRMVQNTSRSFDSEALLVGHMSAAVSLLSYLDYANLDTFTSPLPSTIAIGLAGGNILKHCQYQLHRLMCKFEIIREKLLKKSQLSTSAPFYCPFRGSYSEYFQIKWFFDNWHELLWHDTEVLIAER